MHNIGDLPMSRSSLKHRSNVIKRYNSPPEDKEESYSDEQSVFQRIQDRLFSQKRAQQLEQSNENHHQQGDEKFNRITDYKKASQKMRQTVNNFKNYLNRYGQDGDNQYAYKLVLDFFKSQAQAKNLQQGARTIKLNLHRTAKPIEQIKWKQIPQQKKQNQYEERNIENSKGFVPSSDLDSSESSHSEDSIGTGGLIQDKKLIEKLFVKKNKRRSYFQQSEKAEKSHPQINQNNNSLFKSKSRSTIPFPPPNQINSNHTTHFQQVSDNQVYYDSEQSDQSVISLQSCQQSSQQQGKQQNSQDSYDDSLEQQNLRQFYFEQDYIQQQNFEQENDIDSKHLMKLFRSSRHKKQQSLHRTQYQDMNQHERQKYFKKLNTQFNKRMKRDNRTPLKSGKRKGPHKRISFEKSVRVKVFNTHLKASTVFLTNQKEEVLVRQIWQYDQQ